MLRNKEYSVYLIIAAFISVVLLGISYFVSRGTFIMVIITEIVLGAIFIFYTNWRYREIEKLSGYLREISRGNYGLDVRNNYEGELSILRNEIFKVTERLKQQSEFLKNDKEHLADAIADISHQLKTPLTSMQVMLDLLEQPELPIVKRTEFLHNIQTQLERMEWLISSLLKLSKLDAGTVQFQRDRAGVKALVNQAIQSVAIAIELKEIELQFKGDENAEFIVDQKWTIEAIINVVKNAVEHTPEGGRITFTVTDTPLYVELIIADSGKGIAKEDLPHIFKRFYKGKHAGESSIGIGLALTYSIMQSQNGIVEVKNGTQGGSQFLFKWYKLK